MLELTRASDGEAPARSSLVPRDLTAEFVFDCPRFARGFLPVRIRLAAYLSLFVRFYVYFMSFASLGALSIVIRLAAFFISRCWVTFWALSFYCCV